MELDRRLGLDGELESSEVGARIPPGKTTLTSRLAAPPIVFRVADENVARVLGEAMRGPRGLIQRDVEPGRDANGVAGNAAEAVERAASGSGEPLRADLRERFEASLGADLSAVRIHHGAASADASAAVGAKAYTMGNDIHFASGRYQPDDPFGVHLLAHEVAHTVQQAGASPVRQHKLEVSTPGDASEVEADRAADAMVRGAPAQIGSAPSRIARDPATPNAPDAGAPGKAPDRNASWAPPKADTYPHESVDPRVPKETPPSPDKVWNPPAPDGWRYWPADKRVLPRGKQMTDEALKKPLGTFVQDIVNGELIAARTEWHSFTIVPDENNKPKKVDKVKKGGNLMIPLEQPKDLPKPVQRAADAGASGAGPVRQHKLEVSAPGDASEVEADRAADAMVRGERAAVAGAPGRLARDYHGDPDAGAPETPRSGDGFVNADGTEVVDSTKRTPQVIETLALNAPVKLTADAGNHYKVVTPSGKAGYILRSKVAFEKKEAPKEDKKPSDAPAEKQPDKAPDEKGHWTPPKADTYPHESMDPRVLKEKPASPQKVWNPPAPDGWRYWPGNKKIPPRGKQMTDEALKKPMGTFVQDIVDGELIAARTEWHNATVKWDANKQPYSEPGVFHAGNLMIPLEQPKDLPKKVQRAADAGAGGGGPVRQHKLEVSAPGDASEVEADRAADAMVRGTRATVAGAPARLARDYHGEPDAGAPETPRAGTGHVAADGTQVLDGTSSKATVLETLAKGATVTLTHDVGNHFKVKTESGKVGYVLKSQIELPKKPDPVEGGDAGKEKKAPGTAPLKRPHGLAEIIEVFGKPGTNLGLHEMKCGPKGATQKVYCHNKIAPLLTAVFENIVKDGHADHLHAFGGCYNDREKVGSEGQSIHAWGIAVDINPEGNGKVPSKTPADKVPVSESQKIIAPYFEAQGFVWGKAFGDSMHFQYATGY